MVTRLGTTPPMPLYPIHQQEYGYGGLLVTVIVAALLRRTDVQGRTIS